MLWLSVCISVLFMPSPLAPGAIAGIVISVFAAIAVLLALLIIGILVVKNKSSERVAQNQPTSQAGGLKSEQKSSPDDSSSARRKAPVSDSHTKKPSQDPLAQVTGQHGLPQSSVHSPALSNKAQGSRSLDPIQSRVSIEELGEIVLYQVGVAIAENYMIPVSTFDQSLRLMRKKEATVDLGFREGIDGTLYYREGIGDFFRECCGKELKCVYPSCVSKSGPSCVVQKGSRNPNQSMILFHLFTCVMEKAFAYNPTPT